MFEIEFNITKLIAGRLRNQLSPAEENELTAWLKDSTENQLYYDELTNELILSKELKKFNSSFASSKVKIWSKILGQIEREENLNNQFKLIKIRRYKLWSGIAATLLIPFGIAIWFNANRATNQQSKHTSDIAPGKNEATLTLSNGKEIKLTTGLGRELANENGISISKTKDGQIIYTNSRQNSSESSFPVNYNTLTTSRGQQYKLRLPDSTLVWLNAASSLKYPSSFSNLNTRSVELKGEAYFQVSKDKKHPFIVKTIKQQVEVLGTHFNINSYEDEPDVNTILVEGSVKINNAFLKPGEKATINRSGILKISKTNFEEIAWKDGKFRFKDTDLETVLRQLSRWYNVDVKYKDGIPNMRFTGWIDRKLQISKALEILAYLNINFKIEEKTLTVSNTQN